MNTLSATLKTAIATSILLLCLPLLAVAQDTTLITGVVRDAGGSGLVAAEVRVVESGQTTRTDFSGRYSISYAGPFPATVEASYPGFETVQIQAPAPGSYNLDFYNITSFSGITVVGSRNDERTALNGALPVRVLSQTQLAATGQVDLGQQLQFTEPSFQSAKYGINGSLGYADYATLRGMSPDQVLVLVNGKRRHQFSVPHIGFSIARGMVVTDLNAIPSLALDRVEILKDGAASLYGSDAIAGTLNLRLRESVGVGTFRTQVGATKEGDGVSYMAAGNYGFGLGKKGGFLNITLQHQRQGETDRSDPYTGTIYSGNRASDDSARAVRGVYPANEPFRVGVFGQSEVKTTHGFYNAALPLGKDWKIYSFGGLSYKEALVYGFFRNAIPGNANSNPAIYPDGFTPEFPAKDRDYSAVVGLSRSAAAGWNMDFSASYGRNAVDRHARNTVNASMGAASPTEFFVGSSAFNQAIAEAVFSRRIGFGQSYPSINLALGSQFRVDHYQQGRGDENSYFVGPLAQSNNKAPGVQGIASTAPADEADVTRNNLGVFADAEADLTDKWLVAGALRYEHYSDFGPNLSGRLASRYKLLPGLLVRGSLNRGFRAPSLQQLYNSATSTLVQAGQIRYTKQFRADDPLLDRMGVADPRPEIATSYNLGLSYAAGTSLTITVDAYQVDVRDKIVISEALNVANIAALRDILSGTGIQSISFFTNNVDTRTRGLDAGISYRWRIGTNSLFTAGVIGSFNKTEVTDIKGTPQQIQEGTTQRIALIDTVSIALIETAQPRQKVIFSLGYQFRNLRLMGRATYFGKVAAWERVGANPHVMQEFGDKVLTDASVSYLLFRRLTVTAGANNLGNVYPDRVLPTLSAYGSGQSPFNRNVNQFGFSGAYYYGSLSLNF